jgi:hypothetical protein
VILDNSSTYPPLLEWYGKLPSGIGVVRQPNLGPWSFWNQGMHLSQDTPYVVTDSDIVPADCCPVNLIENLTTMLRKYPSSGKVGPGLRLDNIPDLSRDFITNGDGKGWEGEGVFWKRREYAGAFSAPIDTTFAIYNAHSPWIPADWNNIRLDMPYVVEHTPWYVTELNEEERYYREHVDNVWSHVSWDSPINDKLKKDSECTIHTCGLGKTELPTT